MAFSVNVKMKENEVIFPWAKTVRKRLLKSFCKDNTEDLLFLQQNLHEEFQKLLHSKDKIRLEALYKTISYFYLHFCWKVKWNKDYPMKFYCVQFLYYMVRVGFVLSNGDVTSHWIDQVLTILKSSPGSIDLMFDVLLLIQDMKKKYHHAYALILNHILCKEYIESPDAELFLKILMLFRRLKCLSKGYLKKSMIKTAVSKIKCPPDFVNWISSNIRRFAGISCKNAAKEFLKRNFKTSTIKKILQVLFRNKYDEKIINQINLHMDLYEIDPSSKKLNSICKQNFKVSKQKSAESESLEKFDKVTLTNKFIINAKCEEISKEFKQILPLTNCNVSNESFAEFLEGEQLNEGKKDKLQYLKQSKNQSDCHGKAKDPEASSITFDHSTLKLQQTRKGIHTHNTSPITTLLEDASPVSSQKKKKKSNKLKQLEIEIPSPSQEINNAENGYIAQEKIDNRMDNSFMSKNRKNSKKHKSSGIDSNSHNLKINSVEISLHNINANSCDLSVENELQCSNLDMKIFQEGRDKSLLSLKEHSEPFQALDNSNVGVLNFSSECSSVGKISPNLPESTSDLLVNFAKTPMSRKSQKSKEFISHADTDSSKNLNHVKDKFENNTKDYAENDLLKIRLECDNSKLSKKIPEISVNCTDKISINTHSKPVQSVHSDTRSSTSQESLSKKKFKSSILQKSCNGNKLESDDDSYHKLNVSGNKTQRLLYNFGNKDNSEGSCVTDQAKHILNTVVPDINSNNVIAKKCKNKSLQSQSLVYLNSDSSKSPHEINVTSQVVKTLSSNSAKKSSGMQKHVSELESNLFNDMNLTENKIQMVLSDSDDETSRSKKIKKKSSPFISDSDSGSSQINGICKTNGLENMNASDDVENKALHKTASLKKLDSYNSDSEFHSVSTSDCDTDYLEESALNTVKKYEEVSVSNGNCEIQSYSDNQEILYTLSPKSQKLRPNSFLEHNEGLRKESLAIQIKEDTFLHGFNSAFSKSEIPSKLENSSSASALTSVNCLPEKHVLYSNGNLCENQVESERLSPCVNSVRKQKSNKRKSAAIQKGLRTKLFTSVNESPVEHSLDLNDNSHENQIESERLPLCIDSGETQKSSKLHKSWKFLSEREGDSSNDLSLLRKEIQTPLRISDAKCNPSSTASIQSESFLSDKTGNLKKRKCSKKRPPKTPKYVSEYDSDLADTNEIVTKSKLDKGVGSTSVPEIKISTLEKSNFHIPGSDLHSISTSDCGKDCLEELYPITNSKSLELSTFNESSEAYSDNMQNLCTPSTKSQKLNSCQLLQESNNDFQNESLTFEKKNNLLYDYNGAFSKSQTPSKVQRGQRITLLASENYSPEKHLINSNGNQSENQTEFQKLTSCINSVTKRRSSKRKSPSEIQKGLRIKLLPSKNDLPVELSLNSNLYENHQESERVSSCVDSDWRQSIFLQESQFKLGDSLDDLAGLPYKIQTSVSDSDAKCNPSSTLKIQSKSFISGNTDYLKKRKYPRKKPHKTLKYMSESDSDIADTNKASAKNKLQKRNESTPVAKIKVSHEKFTQEKFRCRNSNPKLHSINTSDNEMDCLKELPLLSNTKLVAEVSSIKSDTRPMSGGSFIKSNTRPMAEDSSLSAAVKSLIEKAPLYANAMSDYDAESNSGPMTEESSLKTSMETLVKELPLNTKSFTEALSVNTYTEPMIEESSQNVCAKSVINNSYESELNTTMKDLADSHRKQNVCLELPSIQSEFNLHTGKDVRMKTFTFQRKIGKSTNGYKNKIQKYVRSKSSTSDSYSPTKGSQVSDYSSSENACFSEMQNKIVNESNISNRKDSSLEASLSNESDSGNSFSCDIRKMLYNNLKYLQSSLKIEDTRTKVVVNANLKSDYSLQNKVTSHSSENAINNVQQGSLLEVTDEPSIYVAKSFSNMSSNQNYRKKLSTDNVMSITLPETRPVAELNDDLDKHFHMELNQCLPMKSNSNSSSIFSGVINVSYHNCCHNCASCDKSQSPILNRNFTSELSSNSSHIPVKEKAEDLTKEMYNFSFNLPETETVYSDEFKNKINRKFKQLILHSPVNPQIQIKSNSGSCMMNKNLTLSFTQSQSLINHPICGLNETLNGQDISQLLTEKHPESFLEPQKKASRKQMLPKKTVPKSLNNWVYRSKTAALQKNTQNHSYPVINCSYLKHSNHKSDIVLCKEKGKIKNKLHASLQKKLMSLNFKNSCPLVDLGHKCDKNYLDQNLSIQQESSKGKIGLQSCDNNGVQCNKDNLSRNHYKNVISTNKLLKASVSKKRKMMSNSEAFTKYKSIVRQVSKRGKVKASLSEVQKMSNSKVNTTYKKKSSAGQVSKRGKVKASLSEVQKMSNSKVNTTYKKKSNAGQVSKRKKPLNSLNKSSSNMISQLNESTGSQSHKPIWNHLANNDAIKTNATCPESISKGYNLRKRKKTPSYKESGDCEWCE